MGVTMETTGDKEMGRERMPRSGHYWLNGALFFVAAGDVLPDGAVLAEEAQSAPERGDGPAPQNRSRGSAPRNRSREAGKEGS